MSSVRSDRKFGALDRMLAQPPGRQAGYAAAASWISLFLAALINVGFLTPLFNAAVIFPFFAAALKKGDSKSAFKMSVRWAVASFMFFSLLSLFFPGRAESIIPFSRPSLEATLAWLSGGTPQAPPSPVAVILSLAVLFSASVLSCGIAGLIMISSAAGVAAWNFTFMARHGDNIIHMVFLGLPPWVIAYLISALFLVVLGGDIFSNRVFSLSEKGKRNRIKHFVLPGLILLLASLALNALLGNIWNDLISGCTTL